MSDLGALLPFIIILLAFWLLIIRPARNRQRQQLNLQRELAPGQHVMTTSGLHATVSAVEDDVVVLEVAPGVTMRWAKQAVARIIPAEPADVTGDETGAAGPAETEPDDHSPGDGRPRPE